MKALGVLESKWNPIRQKLVRRLLEEQDKVSRSYFAQKGGTEVKGGRDSWPRSGACQMGHVDEQQLCILLYMNPSAPVESFRAGPSG